MLLMCRIIITAVTSRRTVLRRGAGVFGVGSAAVVGALGVDSDSDSDSNSNPDSNSNSDSDSGAGGNRRSRSSATTATVLVAGSLQQVTTQVGNASVEAHGSVACRRLLEDGLRDPDAVALADPRLFAGLTERVTCFATNALVLAVSDSIADAYDDWQAVLADPDLSLGRTDPKQDPLGYRTVMALELASDIDAEEVLARTSILPETGLLRTLEAGGLDAAFAYRNMAVEHDLSHLELPDSIDFSDPALADQYGTASLELDEQTVVGAPIRYAANARTERGEKWVEELVENHETLRNSGFGVPEEYPKHRKL